MFRRILVPVGLAEKDARAIEVVRDLASESGGSVTLLHVIEPVDLPFEEMKEFYGRLEEKSLRVLEERVAPLREADIRHSAQVKYGDRASTIVSHAERNGNDVIVMTSHRVDPANPGLGWTTLSYKVAILAQCPVLLVK
ncbi:MAG TPA: universal stress protein [Gemmatimonadota bacterium]|nr:universal stress protein [Gemmatimonadota bacterium]